MAGLHTEQGVDRLARSILGFHGAVLSRQVDGSADSSWGAGAWYPSPLFAAAFREVVLHYQHNLEGGSMAADMSTLCWSLALGIHLSVDLANFRHNASWIATVSPCTHTFYFIYLICECRLFVSL